MVTEIAVSKNDISDNPLSNRIRELRTDVGWSQRDLAKAADTSWTAIHKIESGATRTPNVWLMARIAAVLGTTLQDLLERLGVMMPSHVLSGIDPNLIDAVRGTTPEFQRSLARHVGFLKTADVTGGEGGYADIDFIMDFEQREAMPA